MNKNSYIKLSTCLFFLGVLFYAYYHEYLIIHLKKTTRAQLAPHHTAKQKVRIHFWKGAWKTDEIQLLLNQDTCHNTQLIVANWLENALDEHIIQKRITVQPVMISKDQQHVYVSFDLNPFGKESSTFENWMLIEGILKTIRGALPSVQKISFLVNHQPLTDPHLDFSNPWLVDGFSY